nr:class I SAM-dependent methyltransferase [uncultured Flavobacterium sp.]
MENNAKSHWETIYKTKSAEEVSWTQTIPEPSFSLIKSLAENKSCKIIDIGGGDSRLADFLLDDGYTDITVVDISGFAIEKAKQRLASRADLVKWIQSDIRDFIVDQPYDVWHDRAAFHFLTEQKDVDSYAKKVSVGGVKNLIIGTFSKSGPQKCSGLDIMQYDCKGLQDVFSDVYVQSDCFMTDHETPFQTKQNFVFGVFKRRDS